MNEDNRRRRKQVTIYDVAREAGVAPSTVSRAFARPGRVNAATGERIQQAAAKLGYRAKPISRPKAGEATKVLAFVVADVTNPVYSHIMRGFQQEATTNGYTVLLIEHDLDVVFRLATHVTVLHLGRVLADGTPGEVRADETVQRAYLGDAALDDLFLEGAP